MDMLTHQQSPHSSSSWDKIFRCLSTAGQLRTCLLKLIQHAIKEENLSTQDGFQPQLIKDELIQLCTDYQHTLSQTFRVFTNEVRSADSIVLDDYLLGLSQLLQEQAADEQQYAAEIQDLAGIARHHLSDLNHYGLDFQDDPQLKRVFEYIETNYHEAIGLREVAQALGYSTAYLTDFVRRKTGRPVHQWIVTRRLSEACHLLQNTNQSIESIAFGVGYQNVGHFFRQFRKHYDTTPQTWRNKIHIQ